MSIRRRQVVEDRRGSDAWFGSIARNGQVKAVEDMLIGRKLRMGVMLRMDPIEGMSARNSGCERGSVRYESAKILGHHMTRTLSPDFEPVSLSNSK